MTQQDRLEKIKTRLARVEGPSWGPRSETHEGDNHGGVMVGMGGHIEGVASLVAFVTRWNGRGSIQIEWDHAEFIQHSKDDVEFLLALVEEQQKLIEIMRQDGTPAQDQARKEERIKCISEIQEYIYKKRSEWNYRSGDVAYNTGLMKGMEWAMEQLEGK